jgi:hypothetical protein
LKDFGFFLIQSLREDPQQSPLIGLCPLLVSSFNMLSLYFMKHFSLGTKLKEDLLQIIVNFEFEFGYY